MPRDFNPTGYDLKTTDGTIWKIVEFEDHFELQSEAGSFELMKLDGRFTVFAPGYRNINLHGFEVNGTSYELEEAVPNENWVYVPVPEPGEALYEKERIFAQKLLQLATAFGIDLTTLPDINIGTMLQAAQQAGATETEIANASAILLALAKDVEAESGMVWADTWLALKSRLPGYLQEV
jgi:hypothetical protein